MIDVHAHFADEGYLFPEEWEKIRAAGVTRVILAGDNARHTRMHRDFCETYEGAFFTAGVHPSETGDFTRATLAELRELTADEKCVAVGEIGLDYHYEETDKEKQRSAFEEQLALASSVGLPVQIHSRDACADTLAILKNAEAYFKNAKSVWESVRACPADRLLTETDSPYLSPFRGEKNSPANIPVIADKIAELRGEERSFLVALIDKNAERLFPRVRI